MSDVNAIPQWFSGSEHTHRVAAAIAQYGPIARTTLAQMLGLSQGALSRITSDLIYAGVIEELAGRYIVWIILIPLAKGKFGSSRTPADFAGVVFERTHLHWCQGSWDVDCGRCGERAWRGGVRPARDADRGGSVG